MLAYVWGKREEKRYSEFILNFEQCLFRSRLFESVTFPRVDTLKKLEGTSNLGKFHL